MRYTKFLRKQGEDSTKPLIHRDFCVKLARYITDLEDALVKSMMTHDTICGAPEHPCSCGADDANRSKHNLLQDGERDAGKRQYR